MPTFEEDLVSIITPLYNAERFISETIESVIKQTYTNWEMILVNDCSQDTSVEIVKNFAKTDKRIKLVNLVENSGAAVARNTGIENAKGKYIAFIDSDDCWSETKLAEQLTFMQTNQYGFTYTDLALINENGEVLKDQVNVPASFTYTQLLKNTAIACSTVIIDRKLVGDFRMPLVRKGQDTATWLMLMRERQVSAYGVQEVHNYYRQVQGSISSDRIGALKRTWNTYYNLEKLPLPKAIYYFTCYVFNAIARRL
ncbi:glycosyltransferase family 2 protein [Aerococcaceae bacterium DSM 111021]|nr:glycosyltransferase family 2 protein [Aerococcaceae bacterium DSM 111021]